MNAPHRLPADQPTAAPRRAFLWSLGASVISLILAAGAVLPALWTWLDPLWRRSRPPRAAGAAPAIGEGYYRVAPLDSIPADGVPRRFAIVADRVDAWNYLPAKPIGAVYIRRDPQQTDKLQVFQSICPHAGCSVATVQEAEGTMFHCPCHNSSFAADGHRVARPGKKNPSPRDLDELAYKIDNGYIWVEYKEFYTGRPEKVAKL